MTDLHPAARELLDQLGEARDLADDLASMLDHLLRQLSARIEPDFDDLDRLEQALQRWHERTWTL